MRELYLLSGLGADKRVFDCLDLSDYKINHVNWIDPLADETIADYAQRLLKQIPTDNPTLIGVSFGGIMAIEIGKRIKTDKIILISSARLKSDIPIYYRIVGQFGLHRLMPNSLLKKVNKLTYWFFGVMNEKERSMLKTIIAQTDTKFLKWAIDKIVNWKNDTLLGNVTLIHGTADRILPFNHADTQIKNGGHLMIINKADELSVLIRKSLG